MKVIFVATLNGPESSVDHNLKDLMLAVKPLILNNVSIAIHMCTDEEV